MSKPEGPLNKRRIMIIAVVAVAVGVLGYVAVSLSHAGSGSIPVGEAQSRAPSIAGQRVKVEGRVAPGSVNWDGSARVMKFSLADNTGRLDIVYRGTVPDSFRVGAKLVVEGRFVAGGGFEALDFPQNSLCAICH